MRFLLLTVALFSPVLVSAQRNYVPAVITTLKNDSLRGFIDYRNWNISPSEIRFKESLTDAKDRHFGPGEISGFRIAQPDEAYISHQLKMDITHQELNNLDGPVERVSQDTIVFFRVVQTGSVNLYVYTDKHSRNHYIYEKDGVIKELEYIRAYVNNSSGSGIYENKLYKEQLTEIFKDCPAVAKRASHLNYNETDLSNVFIAYNNCKNPAAAKIPEKKVKAGLAFGVMAGVSFNSFRFTGPGYIFDGSKYTSSSAPIAGLFLEVPFSRNRRQLCLMNELLYRSEKTNGITRIGTTSFNFSFVQLSTMLRYTYPKGSVRPYATFGIGNSLIVSTKENLLIRNTGSSKSVAIDGPRNLEQSLLFGIGAQLRHVNAEVRYAPNNGWSPYADSGVKVKSIQLLAGYRF